MSAQTTDDDAKERFELAKLTYDQVLDATKHQDDKIGRFVTAIAFLTAAAIAFGTRPDVLAVSYDLDGPVPLPGVLFAGFILFVVVAVVFLLMGLGQALRPPRSRSASRLFFLVIARVAQEDWRSLWDDRTSVTSLRQQLTENLVDESHNIAVRAGKKYRRTGEAQALFTIALLFFGLAVALAINVLADPGTGTAPWDLRARAVTAATVSAFAFSLGYGWIREEQKVAQRWAPLALYVLCITGALFPLAVLVVPSVGAAALAFALLSGHAWAWSRCLPGINRLPALMTVTALALAVGAAGAVLAESDRWRVTLAVTSVALFELPRLLSATFKPAPAVVGQSG